jgi:hypothetical protein
MLSVFSTEPMRCCLCRQHFAQLSVDAICCPIDGMSGNTAPLPRDKAIVLTAFGKTR